MKLKPATWTRRAEFLAVLLPKEQLNPEVLAWVDRASANDPWVVALSGGADSTALLLAIWAHWPDHRPNLRAVHFNHRLRGRASEGDETFCRECCAALAIPLKVGRRRLTQPASNEAQARELRFGLIEKEMNERGAKALWLGHQQNDVAEMMLMRLARGSGAGGLAAPRPVQRMPEGRVHLRPLLPLKKEVVEAALTTARIPWREDASNRRRDFFRNRVRLDVVPGWGRAAGRDAIAGAARSRELIAEDDAALEDWADRLYAQMPKNRLDVAKFAELPRAVVRRVLYRWLRTVPDGDGMSRQAFELLLAALILGTATRQSMGRQGFAVIRQKQLRYVSSSDSPSKSRR